MTPPSVANRSNSFCRNGGVQQWLQCAYILLGNGIAERSHCNPKKILARKQCTISEAMYWYKITLKDGAPPATAPTNTIYRYLVREKGIHALQVPENEEKNLKNEEKVPENEEKRRPYAVGDIVWIKTPSSQCTTKFKLGRVTGVVSHHSIEVNRVLHHIKDLHLFQGLIPPSKNKPTVKISQQRVEYQLRSGLLRWMKLQTPPDRKRMTPWQIQVPIILLKRRTQQKSPPPKLHGVQQCRSAGREWNTSCIWTCPAGQWPLNRWKLIREWHSGRPAQEEHLAEEAHSELPVCDRDEGVQDECGSLPPRHKRVRAYATFPQCKTCQLYT